MKSALKKFGFIIICFLPLIALFASESFNKKKAVEVCSGIKIGMTSLELSRYAEEKNASPWAVNHDEILAVAITGFMNSSYFCRIETKNGSVISVSEVQHKPGG